MGRVGDRNGSEYGSKYGDECDINGLNALMIRRGMMIWIVFIVFIFVSLLIMVLVLLGYRLVLRVGDRRLVLARSATPIQVSRLYRRLPRSEPVLHNLAQELPSPALLQPDKDQEVDQTLAYTKAQAIIGTLQEFGVPAQVVEIRQGPRITRFGVQPGFIEKALRNGQVQRRRVKVSAITSLADDLALALATNNLSIQSPVPGKSYIGISIPNLEAKLVTLAGVLSSPEFANIQKKGRLAIALGRDVVGNPVVADLSKMPHLLVAGATGAGKSVCVNAIIASLLFHWGPEQLKLLMIDPKKVELIGYNGIPHLIAPVVTEMDKVLGALTWAVGEMERRYDGFSQVGKRNLASYNQWAYANGEEQLPYLVVIIDELADLMMTVPEEVEPLIVRLAQLARATGIHLVLATQRPTVKVVTGLIKANIPARIAFAVASSIDSRVILDVNGAESLLGRGDMLYKAANALGLLRLQGCFVSDEELERLVTHWLSHETDDKDAGVLFDSLDVTPQTTLPDQEKGDAPIPRHASVARKLRRTGHDKLLPKAIELARQHQTVSTSFFQRKLRIGYARAARLVDTLEEKGIIGPQNDRRGRQVLEEEE